MKPESFWHRLLDWLARPNLSVRLLQAELDRAHNEIRRLNDLLTQAWESARVVPVQGEHRQPLPPPALQRQSYGEIQAEYTKLSEENYQKWLADEELRLKRNSELTSKPN